MKHDEVCWVLVDREDLLDVVLGERIPLNISCGKFPETGLYGTKLAVGYRYTQVRTDYTPPSLIVLPDNSAVETLSWLRTFCSEIFPLSQFGRVLFVSEWHRFNAQLEVFNFGEQRSDRWASIIVGEALSQIEGETSLVNLPLSRFAGCFTTPIARAAVVWGHNEATRTCTERLRLLEGDPRFSRKPVSVKQLLPIWAISGAPIHGDLSPSEAANLVLEAADKHLGAGDQESAALASLIQTPEFSRLNSDSVEERVSAFNRLSSQILPRTHPKMGTTESAMISVSLAAAAFLVGRSTSHVFLLQRAQRFAPTATAWFGAMAALAGPRVWDNAWLKAAKGAERLLRPDFSWLEVPSADICWSEFAWLARTFDGSDVFLDLPKMLPRALSIEIVPGATCQVRIGSDAIESELKPVQAPSARERTLSDAVGQFLMLAQRIESQIAPNSSTPRSRQQSMDFNNDFAVNKSPRTRKPRKSTSDK